jgi:antitoxin (DNA-binding transcriptional repressor) of toxin-antitoxin stability system
MTMIGLYDAKTRLSALVAEIEASGEKILLTRHGKIVAELCPATPQKTPVRGCLKSASFVMAEDFDASEAGFEDFFEEPDHTMVVEDNSRYEK